MLKPPIKKGSTDGKRNNDPDEKKERIRVNLPHKKHRDGQMMTAPEYVTINLLFPDMPVIWLKNETTYRNSLNVQCGPRSCTECPQKDGKNELPYTLPYIVYNQLF